MSKKKDKKEKVIHTRISEALEQELKARASGLGVSVSNLVRNVLLTTFGRMEGMAREGADFARSIAWHHPGPEAAESSEALQAPQAVDTVDAAQAAQGLQARHVRLDAGAVVSGSQSARGVIGWQRLILELNAVCSRCNAILPRGSDAAIAVTAFADESRPLLCVPCLDALRAESEPSSM